MMFEIVPLVVIALALSIAIGEVALIVTLVTVPLGSSPEGIRTHVLALDVLLSQMKVSPTLAA